MGSEVGRLSNWSRTGVVDIFYFQPTLYFSKGNFSLDKYQCVPVYQANYLQRKYIIIKLLLARNSEWQTGKGRWNQSKLLRFGLIFGTAIWFQGNPNLLTITFQSESEKTTAGILKTASRALVETHAHSVSAGIFQESCEACRHTKTHAIALEIVADHLLSFNQKKGLLFGTKLLPNLWVKFPLPP